LEAVAEVVEYSLGTALRDLLGDVFQRIVVHAEQPDAEDEPLRVYERNTKTGKPEGGGGLPQVVKVVEGIGEVVDVIVVEGQHFKSLHATHLGRELGELVLIQVQLGKRQKLQRNNERSAATSLATTHVPKKTYIADLRREHGELVVVEEEAREASEFPRTEAPQKQQSETIATVTATV
jgi:hypothetical protein